MAGMNFEIKWETRLCEVDGELGYFHTWEQRSDVVEPSIMRGGHPGGSVSRVYGIVEFKDRVRRVDPYQIKFCDEINAGLSVIEKNRKKHDGYFAKPFLDESEALRSPTDGTLPSSDHY